MLQKYNRKWDKIESKVKGFHRRNTAWQIEIWEASGAVKIYDLQGCNFQ